MKLFSPCVCTLVLTLALAGAAHASVTSLVGDKDGFGIIGAPAVPSDGSTFAGIGGSYSTDYRDATDLATAPFTDIWASTQGVVRQSSSGKSATKPQEVFLRRQDQDSS